MFFDLISMLCKNGIHENESQYVMSVLYANCVIQHVCDAVQESVVSVRQTVASDLNRRESVKQCTRQVCA